MKEQPSITTHPEKQPARFLERVRRLRITNSLPYQKMVEAVSLLDKKLTKIEERAESSITNKLWKISEEFGKELSKD